MFIGTSYCAEEFSNALNHAVHAGTESKANVTLSLDAVDVTPKFSPPHLSRMFFDDDGLAMVDWTARHELTINAGDNMTTKLGGKTLSCNASMPLYDTVTTSSVIYVSRKCYIGVMTSVVWRH